MLNKHSLAAVPMMLVIVLALMSLSCGDDGPTPEVWTDISRSDAYTGGDHVILVDTTGNVNLTYTLNVGDNPRDVYFIFTNTTMSDAGSNPVVKSVAGEVSESDDQIMSDSELYENSPFAIDTNIQLKQKDIPEIIEFNKRPIINNENANTSVSRSIIQMQPPLNDTVGQSSTFYDDVNNPIEATCRKILSKNVSDGIPVTLNVWVANDCWNKAEDGCTKSRCVTQTMVDILTTKFLSSGNYNDIYEWITNIFGIEWGPFNPDYNSYLIPDNDELTILLYDINSDDSTTGGVLGYYYSRDNFLSSRYQYSNQRIMFNIDAVLYATGSGSWDISDYWPSLIISSLAHEFQHVINYYQKNVLFGNQGSETWLNEMCSLVAEDFVSSKLGIKGPRGVDPILYFTGSAGIEGNTNPRLPEYNYYNYISLTKWNSLPSNYAIVYAFGA